MLTDICAIRMFICMRTTLNLDDHLMSTAKKRAAESGRTLTALIEAALRDLLERETAPVSHYQLQWTTVPGGLQPGVDLADRDALYDLMEGRR